MSLFLTREITRECATPCGSASPFLFSSFFDIIFKGSRNAVTLLEIPGGSQTRARLGSNYLIVFNALPRTCEFKKLSTRLIPITNYSGLSQRVMFGASSK